MAMSVQSLFPEPAQSVDALFEQFWKWVPRKKKKKDARREFERVLRDGADFNEIVAGARLWNRMSRGTPEKFIPHPRTWLHNWQWHDEYGVSIVGTEIESDPGCADGVRIDLYDEWRKASERLAADDGPRYTSWFASLTLIGSKDGTPILKAPSAFHADYIRNNLDQPLAQAWGRRVNVVS